MEVHVLKMSVSQADLGALALRFMPPDSPLEDVRVQIDSEGVCIQGVYPLLVNVAFSSWWRLGVADGKVTADIVKLKAFGMPGMVFKSAILKAIQQIAAKETWIEVKGEEVHLDLEHPLSREACPTRLNLRSIICGDGILVIEAG